MGKKQRVGPRKGDEPLVYVMTQDPKGVVEIDEKDNWVSATLGDGRVVMIRWAPKGEKGSDSNDSVKHGDKAFDGFSSLPSTTQSKKVKTKIPGGEESDWADFTSGVKNVVKTKVTLEGGTVLDGVASNQPTAYIKSAVYMSSPSEAVMNQHWPS